MKFVFAAFACLAITASVALPRKGLGHIFEQLHAEVSLFDVNRDIQDIIDLIPRDKIEQMVNERAETNEEVRNDLEYVRTEFVHTSVLAIENSAEFLKVRHSLEDVNVNVAYLINYVHDILQWEHVSYRSSRATSSGLRQLLDDVRDILPLTRIRLLIAQKMLFSSGFRKLVFLLLSSDFTSEVNAVASSPDATALIKDAEAHGVDVQAIMDFAKSLASIVYEASDPRMLQ